MTIAKKNNRMYLLNEYKQQTKGNEMKKQNKKTMEQLTKKQLEKDIALFNLRELTKKQLEKDIAKFKLREHLKLREEMKKINK